MRLHLKSIARVVFLLVVIVVLVPALYKYLDTKSDKSSDMVLRFRDKKSEDDGEPLPNVLPIPEHGNEPIHDDEEYIAGRPIVYRQPSLAAKLTKNTLGNYEPREREARTGPGENGEALHLSAGERALADRTVAEYGFNMVASDRMAMDRTIPDTRLDECRYWQYPDEKDLPSASVIVVFHNEGMSTLMRTIHSIVNRSPDKLLKEVIMVDDFSDKTHLKKQLEDYIAENFPKVKLFRNEKREGLIRTRTKGAEYATGDVIIFLDAHCECNTNWLPPLLTRIAVDRSIMAVPIVDGINWNTMQYTAQYRDIHYMGIFEWGFLYKEARVPEQELKKRKHHSEPFRSPTHAGGLFAMDRKYFFELGAYDPGLLIWGGENFELSFKIWQCGGQIEWVPCSRVGHIYRNHMPYSIGHVESKISPILLNYIRVVEVWMEEPYKTYFYTREPKIRGYPPGNITAQLALKERYHCKNFQWYIDNIAYRIKERFPFPPSNQFWGEIRVRGKGLCWDTYNHGPDEGKFGLSGCHQQGGNQFFRLNTEGQLGAGERCLDARAGGVGMTFCPTETDGPWHYDEDTFMMHHKTTKTCAEGDGTQLRLVKCDEGDEKQKWTWKEVQPWKDQM